MDNSNKNHDELQKEIERLQAHVAELEKASCEQKRIEEEVALRQKNLEKQMEERTEELVKANKQLKQEIIESKEKGREAAMFRSAIEQVPVGIAMADADLNLYFCNLAGLEIRGENRGLVNIPKEEYGNWQILKLTGEPYEIEDIPLVKAVSKGLISREEFIIKHQDGSEHICESISTPVYGEGVIIGGLIVFSDITERKEVQEKAKQQQYYFEKAQDIVRIGTWELDLVKNNLIWTEENYRIFGIPLGKQMTYRTFMDCVHPDDREFVDQKWQAGLKGETYDIEHRLLVDGKIKWVREKAYVEFNRKGTAVKAIGIAQDITDRKLIEEELRESERRFRTMFENTPLGYQSLNSEGRLLEINPAWLESLGYTREEALGKSFSDFLTPASKEKFGECFPKFKEKGETADVQFEMVRKDGTIMLVSIDGRVAYDSHRQFKRTHCIVHDITKRRQREE